MVKRPYVIVKEYYNRFLGDHSSSGFALLQLFGVTGNSVFVYLVCDMQITAENRYPQSKALFKSIVPVGRIYPTDVKNVRRVHIQKNM